MAGGSSPSTPATFLLFQFAWAILLSLIILATKTFYQIQILAMLS
ncbi:hypothetical protein GPAL_1690 [Glaciecola pallidula DSM 14239 = ACAM 615]|uniref:Uncharacterized protein n=1 Tax=Brumicola pallidula DSM 14239 = ACAM 615 TaxID=1121922 RepID=K6ZI33_9ALTE|nr:hypothetical protein GPAL_1690 [Glaciecola pallidula DSM 14239 = ACAM 615]